MISNARLCYLLICLIIINSISVNAFTASRIDSVTKESSTAFATAKSQQNGQRFSRTSLIVNLQERSPINLQEREEVISVSATENNSIANNEMEDNDTVLGRFLRGIIRTGLKEEINRESIVIAKADIPSLGIWMDHGYELQSIYLQNYNTETNSVEKIMLDNLEVGKQQKQERNKYIQLYSPVYHKDSGPVIVTPEEVGLVSLRDEVFDSVLTALPVLAVWMTLIHTFASDYTQRYGGTFSDAFWGT